MHIVEFRKSIHFQGAIAATMIYKVEVNVTIRNVIKVLIIPTFYFKRDLFEKCSLLNFLKHLPNSLHYFSVT